jgi:uncharacterized protein YkwD
MRRAARVVVMLNVAVACLLLGCEADQTIRVAGPAASDPVPRVTSAAVNAAGVERDAAEVLRLVNHERAQGGLRTLTLDAKLTDAARAHALDLVKRGVLTHRGADGSSVGDRATRAGYAWSRIAENVAGGTIDMPPQAAVEGWMNSPGHRANLLHPDMVHLGAARVGNTWVLVLGAPR